LAGLLVLFLQVLLIAKQLFLQRFYFDIKFENPLLQCLLALDLLEFTLDLG
jgi:hypothetical protein